MSKTKGKRTKAAQGPSAGEADAAVATAKTDQAEPIAKAPDPEAAKSVLDKLHAGRKVAAVYFPVAELKKWDKNPRKIPEQAVTKVMAIIQTIGWGAPALARASDQRLIAGHTRLEAATRLGMAEVPVRFMEVTDEEADILALADNRLGQESEWDYEGLATILRGFADDATRLLTGFDQHEVEPLLAAEWKPPEIGALPDRSGGGSGGASASKTIHLTEEQRAIVDDALVHARRVYGDEVTEGAFIADLCGKFAAAQDEAQAATAEPSSGEAPSEF